MKITDWLFNVGETENDEYQYVINIENEIWLAFAQELLNWNEKDIYAISFFVEFDLDNQSDVRLYFGYNTETQYKNEQCDDIDDETIRWNYNFWLQNETFCFGEDGMTKNIIQRWLKQQKLGAEYAVEELVKNIITAIQEIHKCGIIEKKLGAEIPVIIHTYSYHENIANINIKANGKYLDYGFVHYCSRNFEE